MGALMVGKWVKGSKPRVEVDRLPQHLEAS